MTKDGIIDKIRPEDLKNKHFCKWKKAYLSDRAAGGGDSYKDCPGCSGFELVGTEYRPAGRCQIYIPQGEE